MKRQSSPHPKFRPFYEARPEVFSFKPTPILMSTQRRVFANAIILTELGFVQSNPANKPWLFAKTIHRIANVILYADLGGRPTTPIYEDTSVWLYTSDECRGGDSKINDYIVRKFGERLQEEGVQVRSEPIDVDPVPRVNSRMLGSMLRYVNPGFTRRGRQLPRKIRRGANADRD